MTRIVKCYMEGLESKFDIFTNTKLVHKVLKVMVTLSCGLQNILMTTCRQISTNNHNNIIALQS